MTTGLKITTRVAVFASLVFIFSFFSVYFPNVNPAFFIVFSAGFLWGVWPGIGVGVVGFFLWSALNPLGPPMYPILLAQLIGISFSGMIGAAVFKLIGTPRFSTSMMITLVISGIFCGLAFQAVVAVVDAWFNQPFWPRLIGGLLFSLITVISNAIIFPLFYPVLSFLYEREKRTA